jgi:hypothetical protein
MPGLYLDRRCTSLVAAAICVSRLPLFDIRNPSAELRWGERNEVLHCNGSRPRRRRRTGTRSDQRRALAAGRFYGSARQRNVPDGPTNAVIDRLFIDFRHGPSVPEIPPSTRAAQADNFLSSPSQFGGTFCENYRKTPCIPNFPIVWWRRK